MPSIEEQLLTLQNRLLEEEKERAKIERKIDELTERADFYENLHNNERAQLFELQKKNVDAITAKSLIGIVVRRGRHRIKRMLFGDS